MGNLRGFIRDINGCENSGEGLVAVFRKMRMPVERDAVILVLNSILEWEKAIAFFNWVKSHKFLNMETTLYNVVMKCLKNGRQFDAVEGLAVEMIEDGIALDNITYCTIITCAKRCGRFDKAVKWFERMYATGLMPDEVTYCAALDVYACLGKVEEVRSLYERGMANGWIPDVVTLSVLCKSFGAAGDCNGVRFVMTEMRSLGVKPNLVLYNTLIEAMGKAGKAAFARVLFEDMVNSGVTPDVKTLTTLLKIYGKARWSRNAMELRERMRSNGWPVDLRMYNTLLSMFADLGQEEEVERLFEEMRESEHCIPDNYSYTALVNVYAHGGKVDKAVELFKEMLELDVKPNVMIVTCLIQCLGRAGRMDDLVEIFEVATGRGVVPDDQLCACLLSVVSLCKNKDDEHKVLQILQVSNPRWAFFVKLIKDREASYQIIREEFKAIITEAQINTRRAVCNCLIDICRSNDFHVRAHELLHLGNLNGLYRNLQKRTPEEWSLNVKTLSVGAALTALEDWITSLTAVVEHQGELPRQFSAYTGAGTHRFSKGLPAAFAAHVEQLSAPFTQSEDQAGCFKGTREEVVSWVQSRTTSHAPVAA